MAIRPPAGVFRIIRPRSRFSAAVTTMPSPALLLHLFADLLTPGVQARVAEPQLSMDDPDAAAAFHDAGRSDGLLAASYLYHAIQASAQIPPAARVLDLGCGPANQLAVIADICADARFTGIDASPAMLELAATTLERCGRNNVALHAGRMEALEGFADASFDAVISTVSLHHLPDCASLHACMRSVRRVLRAGGGLYLADFGRLSRQRTQHFFAHERSAVQPPLFTADYYNSLRAAFSLAEWRAAARHVGNGVRIERSFLVPFMVVLRTHPGYAVDSARRQRAAELWQALSRARQRDLRDLARFLGHGGYALAYPPWRPQHR